MLLIILIMMLSESLPTFSDERYFICCSMSFLRDCGDNSSPSMLLIIFRMMLSQGWSAGVDGRYSILLSMLFSRGECGHDSRRSMLLIMFSIMLSEMSPEPADGRDLLLRSMILASVYSTATYMASLSSLSLKRPSLIEKSLSHSA